MTPPGSSVKPSTKSSATARDTAGKSSDEVLANLDAAVTKFSQNVKAKFKRDGEW